MYSGDEIAQENDRAYHDDPLKREDSRYLHRGNLDWKKAQLRKKSGTPEGRVFSAIRHMEQLRGAHSAFDTEADAGLLDTGSDQVLGIGRYCKGEQLLALFNFGDEERTVWLRDEKPYTDLMDASAADAGRVVVPAHGFRWLLHQF